MHKINASSISVQQQHPFVMIHAGYASVFLLPLLQLAAGQLGTNPKALVVCGGSLGCLRGIHMPGYQIKRFEAFLGIPYALPPVGELRFSVSRWHSPYPSVLICWPASRIPRSCPSCAAFTMPAPRSRTAYRRTICCPRRLSMARRIACTSMSTGQR